MYQKKPPGILSGGFFDVAQGPKAYGTGEVNDIAF